MARREDRKGFYERKNAEGETEIWTLDWKTLEYRREAAASRLGEAGKSIDELSERLRTLFHSNDKAGEFLRETLAPTLVYTARVTPEIADSIVDVDRVMRWGFAARSGRSSCGTPSACRRVPRPVRPAHEERPAPALANRVLDARANRFRDGLVAPPTAALQSCAPPGTRGS